jgi:hypothetical protein
MDGPIQRIPPPGVLPLAGPTRTGERSTRGGKPFSLDAEAEVQDEEPREEPEHPIDEDRPVGHADDDEAGTRVDFTA